VDNDVSACLNKREHKYLQKIVQMAEQPVFMTDTKRAQPLFNGSLLEFQGEWPKSNQKSLINIQRMLS
jgi:hypothetical protein